MSTTRKAIPNLITGYFICSEPTEQQALNALTISGGNTAVGKNEALTIPLYIKDYELLTDDDDSVEAVAISAESLNGTPIELTFYPRNTPNDLDTLDRLVEIDNNGLRSVRGGKMTLSRSKFEVNKDTWVGPFTFAFSRISRGALQPRTPAAPQPTTPALTPEQAAWLAKMPK